MAYSRREALHQRARRMVLAELVNAKLETKQMPRGSAYDFLVNGVVRLAVRGANLHYRGQIATAPNGKRYRYKYQIWLFNFHHHGRLAEPYADFVCCVKFEKKSGKNIFVIPWGAITSATFSHRRPIRRKTYHGQFAPYLNLWDPVSELVYEKTRLMAAQN